MLSPGCAALHPGLFSYLPSRKIALAHQHGSLLREISVARWRSAAEVDEFHFANGTAEETRAEAFEFLD
jgi:hypothetical protein